MIETAYVVRDGRAVAVDRETAANASGEAGALAWIHIDGRDAEALRWLRERPDLPPIVLAALTATETRPRTEWIGDGALVNLRGLAHPDDDSPDALASIRIWATRGRVLSVSFRTIESLRQVGERLRAGRVLDPGDLIVAVAAEMTEALDPEVAGLGDLLDDCEADLSPTQGLAMRRRIGQARATAIAFRRFIVPQRQALERLAALEIDWLDEPDRQHLRGAADRFARMAEELEAVRERAALMHEQLTDLRAEQIESRALLVSIVALVFLPLTFLTGLLGMNVAGIPYAHAPWAFWGVVAVCAVIAVAVVAWFAARRWFGS